MFMTVYAGVGYFTKGIFPWRHSQVATCQMCNFPSGNFPKVISLEAPHAGCNDGDGGGGGGALWQGLSFEPITATWEVATW